MSCIELLNGEQVDADPPITGFLAPISPGLSFERESDFSNDFQWPAVEPGCIM